MNNAIDYICNSDKFILSCLGKRLLLSNYQSILDDAIAHAKLEALDKYHKTEISKELNDILASSAYRYIKSEIDITNNDLNIITERYVRNNTDVDFTKLKYYKQFYNSRSKIEQIIMETRADHADSDIVTVITGYDTRYIAVRIYQLRKKYKTWLPQFKEFLRRANQRKNDIKASSINIRILNLLKSGYNTTYIANKLNINNRYAAVLVCNIRKEILSD